MKHFEPLMTYLSPCFTAVVRIPDTSEPASGSVRQNEASFGDSVSIPRYFFLTSSEPPRAIGAVARPLQPRDVWIPEQPHESSSSIRQPSRQAAPAPPYPSGMCEFISPTSQAFSMMSCGQVPSRSYSHATGRISLTAKSCAISRRLRCSSVSVKSTIGSVPCLTAGKPIDWSVNRACAAMGSGRGGDRQQSQGGKRLSDRRLRGGRFLGRDVDRVLALTRRRAPRRHRRGRPDDRARAPRRDLHRPPHG